MSKPQRRTSCPLSSWRHNVELGIKRTQERTQLGDNQRVSLHFEFATQNQLSDRALSQNHIVQSVSGESISHLGRGELLALGIIHSGVFKGHGIKLLCVREIPVKTQ